MVRHAGRKLSEVIGFEGAMIKGIKQHCQCANVYVSEDDYIHVCGREVNVDWALYYLDDIIDGDSSRALLDILHLHTVTIPVTDQTQVGRVIGKSRAGVDFLKSKFGLLSCSYHDEVSAFRLKGDEGAVRVAARYINNILAGGTGTEIQDHEIKVPCPRARAGAVIGKQGAVIKRILALSGAKRCSYNDDEQCVHVIALKQSTLKAVEAIIIAIVEHPEKMKKVSTLTLTPNP